MKRPVVRASPLSVFGDTVRQLRRARGLSQEALAERSNLHINFVGRIERGQIISPELISVLKLAVGLDVDPRELLEGFTPELMDGLRPVLLRESKNPHRFVRAARKRKATATR